MAIKTRGFLALIAVLGLLGLTLLAACGTGTSTTTSPPTTSVSTSPSTTSAPTTTVVEMSSVKFMTGSKNIIAADLAFVVAQEQGYYKDAGMDVAFIWGDGYGASLRVLGTGGTDYAETDLASATAAVEEKLPVTSVAIYAHNSSAGMIFHSTTPIKTPEDIRGKKIATSPGSGSGLMFDVWLAANGLTEKDITRVNVPGHQKPIVFAQNKVDAYVGWAYDDLPEARKIAGPDAVGWYYFTQDNIKIPGLGIEASSAEASSNPDRVKAFIAATKKGYEFAVNDPVAAVALAVKLQPTTDPKLLGEQWQIFSEGEAASVDPSQPWGYQDPAAWVETVKVFGSAGKSSPMESYFTNEFLAAN